MTLLTLQEAAARCRVSVRTLEREAAEGRLAIVRIRTRRLIEPGELDRYIAASRQCQSAARATDGKCWFLGHTWTHTTRSSLSPVVCAHCGKKWSER